MADDDLSTKPSFTLFPAYSSAAKPDSSNDGCLNTEKSDWLCNSSFAPKTLEKVNEGLNAIQQGEGQSNAIELESRIEKKRSKKHKKEKKKRKHSPDPLKFEPNISLSDSNRQTTSKRHLINEIALSHNISLKLDHRGDPENFYYECLSKGDTARYKPSLKVPIGCESMDKDLWFPRSPHTLKEDILRYFSKKALKVFVKYSTPDEILKRDSFSQKRGPMNYIPVPQDVDQSASKSEGYFEGISTSWRPDTSKKTPTDDTVTDTIHDSELKQKTIAFNKKLSESPHDIDLWLEFVDFQNEVFRDQKSSEESNSAHKKVAILDKALHHNPRSIPLNIARLELCRSLSTVEEVMKAWDSLIFVNPNNPQVWQEYVVFVLTNLTYFNTPRVLKVFSKCLRTLSDIKEGIIISHSASENIMYDMLELVSNLCFVLKSCGYTERAVAIFQALIEFNLFAVPSSAKVSLTDRIICFEPFWDSGVARFGEEGAIGWATTMQEKKITYNVLVSQSDLNNEEEDILEKKLSESATWLRFEKLREFHHWLPWRPNPEYDQTEDDIDDVDRTVSFENISKFMFRIQSAEHQFLLLTYFVEFLGFNPHHFSCTFRDRNRNTYLRINNFHSISKKLNDELLKFEHANPLIFSDCVWTKDRVTFMKNVFSQGLPKLEPKYRTLFAVSNLKFLQMISESSPTDSKESCKKFAKNVLKQPENRNCLQLWLEYIKMETTSNSESKAKKTAETLLTSSSLAITNSAIDMKEVWYFVRSYIDLCLNIEKTSKMNTKLMSASELIWIITHIGAKEIYAQSNNEQIKPVLMLKAISGFKTSIEHELQCMNCVDVQLCYCLDPCSYSLLDCVKCYAFLLYFAQGVDAAVKVLKEIAEQVDDKILKLNKRFLLEKLCCFQAQLLNFHLQNSTTSMRPLQQHLYDSIAIYPESIQLLLMLVKLRNASSVINPTRRFFSKLLKENKEINPITWLFVLASELSLHCSLCDRLNNEPENSGEANLSSSGVKWKIRSLFEKALSSPKCSYVAVLWRLYLKFEILNNEEERARSVCLRALQNCGWSKELLMDDIMYFPDDLQQTVNFMIEKQIRLHTPIEEIQLLMEHGL